jgi:AcrR family transcriptional regulator
MVKPKHQEPKIRESQPEDSSRQKILEVATKLFSEKGFERTSTREIAQESQLNISLISYYFENKEGLYKGVIQEFAHKMREESERIFATLDIEKLDRSTYQGFMHELIFKMLPMKYAFRDMNLLLHREVIEGLPYAQEVFEQVFSIIAEKLVRIIEKAQERNIVRKDIDPYLLFFSMVHSVDQFILMNNRCHTPIQKKMSYLPNRIHEYAEQIFKIFVEGVMYEK